MNESLIISLGGKQKSIVSFSGTNELLKGQLFNRLTQLIDKSIAALFFIRLKRLLSSSSFMGNMPIIELKTMCCDARIESIVLDVNEK